MEDTAVDPPAGSIMEDIMIGSSIAEACTVEEGTAGRTAVGIAEFDEAVYLLPHTNYAVIVG